MTKNLNPPDQAARKIEDFLKVLSTTGGLRLNSKILACNGQVQPNSSDSAGAPDAGSVPPSSSDINPDVTVELSGPDTPLLLARNGELLLAIEHIAAKILRPPAFGATLISLDSRAAEALPGVTVVHDGAFVGVTAPDDRIQVTSSLRLLRQLADRCQHRPFDAMRHPRVRRVARRAQRRREGIG